MTCTTQIWVVLLIGCAMQEICFSQQKHYPDLGSEVTSLWIFCTCFSDGETSNGVTKCPLFSQATLFTAVCTQYDEIASHNFLTCRQYSRSSKLQDSRACSDLIKLILPCSGKHSDLYIKDLHCMVFNCLAVCWRKPLIQSLQLSIVVHPIRSKGWIHLRYTRITIAFGRWNNEKFQRANATTVYVHPRMLQNESTKLSFNMSRFGSAFENQRMDFF